MFGVCVLFIYTISISILCVSQEELNLIESKDISLLQVKNFWKANIFDVSKLFIQYNTNSCCEYVAVGINIYLYECVSLIAPVCAACFCVYVFVISNQSTSKKTHYVVDLRKPDAFLHKTHSKALVVLLYQGSTCVDP